MPVDARWRGAAPSVPAEAGALDWTTLSLMAALIGREAELSLLVELIRGARPDYPGLVFVAGEAGAGKSRLVDEALQRLSCPVLRGEAVADSPSPYEPLVEALRGYYRSHPDTLAARPLAKYLSVLLPELGVEPVAADQRTLSAAICDAAAVAAEQGAVLVLEDLHWADAGTLDVLLDLAKLPAQSELRIVATYRNDELPRLHRLRGVRSELRRARRLSEVVLEPLSREDAFALTTEVAGTSLPAELLLGIYERSEGIPFFIEELAAVTGRALDPGGGEARHKPHLPETIRDAIRQRTSSLDQGIRDALDVMAVAGPSIRLPLFADVADPDAVAGLLEHGWLVESGDGTAWFRHALVRDAVYSDIPWPRRRGLHRSLAEVLDAQASAPETVAHHWLAAHDPLRARPYLLAAARSFCALHAYRDAQALLRHALEGWVDDERDAERVAVLELMAECVELSGDRDEAATIWRNVTKSRRALGDVEAVARAQRRLATVLEMQNDWSAAVDARVSAAAAFAECGQPAEAATERITAAHHLHRDNDLTPALELVELAATDAEAASATELTLRARALRGEIRAQMGKPDGVEMARDALGAALSEGYTSTAAEAYYALAGAIQHSARYEGALDAYEQASQFCKSQGMEDFGTICFACLAPTLRHVGRWKEATEVCRSVLADPDSSTAALNVASCELGLVQALKGNVASARRLLGPSLRFARAYGMFALTVETTWGTAMVAALEGKDEQAAATATGLIEDCRRREEWHYSLSAMRWCITWFAVRGDARMVNSAARVLSDAAAAKGSREARSALAYALAEGALLEGNAELALSHARQTLELLEGIAAPYEVAEMRARCAVALAGGGERSAALEALTSSYRTAKKLGARPLANAIVERFADLGEPVEPHLGRGATAGAERGGLSRRELDVLRHVAAGSTNKQIAALFFLSTRTVDMHVRNILTKLDCRSRTEAAARAAELQLLGQD